MRCEIIKAIVLNRLLVTTTVMVLAFAAVHAQPQVRKSSTPEERAKAVAIARSLETDSLSKNAKEQRRWITLWLIEVPDISVKMCGNLLRPLLDANKNYSAEIFTQMVPSEAAFIIQNPDKANDIHAIYTAGVEGSLRTYEAILKAKPKSRWQFLDDLIQKRDSGELATYVQKAAMPCK